MTNPDPTRLTAIRTRDWIELQIECLRDPAAPCLNRTEMLPHEWCEHCLIKSLLAQLDAQAQTIATLRSALVGLVGVDGREDLEQMEAAMRLTPAPAADKTVTIDAIHALIATETSTNFSR